METQWIREHMETEQVISAKPTQITVEAESALPGGLREEARVFYADALAAVQGGEIAGSRVTADGRVTFHVLYAQGDMTQVKALEATADFSQALPLQEEGVALTAARLRPQAQVQHVSAKAFNGRMLMRAIVYLTAEAVQPQSVTVIRDAAEEGQVERALETLTVQRTVGEGEAQTLQREEFELADVLQIRDTLYATAQAQVEDILGGADGRATVTGTITLEAYHTSDMPGRPLVYTRHTMPFEQAVGLSGALGDALAAESTVKDVAVLSQETDGDRRILRAEVLLATAISAVENKEITVLKDVFTTQGDAVQAVTEMIPYRRDTVHAQAAESGRAVITLPEGSPRVKTALLGFIRPILVEARRQRDQLTVEGILETALIYRTDDSDAPVAVEQEQPFRVSFSTDALPEDHLTLTAVQVEPSAITGDRVELKYILCLQARGLRCGQAPVVTEVNGLPPEEGRVEPGVILYFLQPGEDMWAVAKRYRIPLQEMQKMNPSVGSDAPSGTPVIAYKR